MFWQAGVWELSGQLGPPLGRFLPWPRARRRRCESTIRCDSKGIGVRRGQSRRVQLCALGFSSCRPRWRSDQEVDELGHRQFGLAHGCDYSHPAGFGEPDSETPRNSTSHAPSHSWQKHPPGSFSSSTLHLPSVVARPKRNSTVPQPGSAFRGRPAA